MRQPDLFTITDQSERQITLTIPCLYHDKERSSILQTLLLKREAIKMVLIEREKNIVHLLFAPDKLAKENLLTILENVLKHFSGKPNHGLEKHTSPVKQNEPKHNLFFKVDGMSCESCALFVAMVLSREPEIIQADIDFNARTGNVQGYLNKDEVFEIIEKSGYLAFPIEKKL